MSPKIGILKFTVVGLGGAQGSDPQKGGQNICWALRTSIKGGTGESESQNWYIEVYSCGAWWGSW